MPELLQFQADFAAALRDRQRTPALQRWLAGSSDVVERRVAIYRANMVAAAEKALVSEHLCWGGVGGVHFNDLLPFPYTAEALALLADRVDRVQTALKRRILLENLSAYVACRDSEMSETAFLAELARRTGCGLLLDVNNLYVNAINFGFDPLARLGELDGASIGQIHLAGHTVVDDCLVDTHGALVCDPVWSLYEQACRRFGPKPTLIEWDTDLAALDVLLSQAAQADAIARCEVAHA